MPGSRSDMDEVSLLSQVYNEYKTNSDESILVQFMELVYEEAKKTLLSMSYKEKIDVEDVAREYSVYLSSRLWEGTLPEIISWNSYIACSIQEILKYNSQKLFPIEDLTDFLIALAPEEDNHVKNVDKGVFTHFMQYFYSESEIKRLVPFAINIVKSLKGKVLESEIPGDISCFIKVALVLAHRILSEKVEAEEKLMNLEHLPPALFKSVFLLSGLTLGYKELCLTLSYPDLVRLAIIAGGKKLKIPTLRELDTLVVASECMWRGLIEEKSKRQITQEVKEDLGYDHDVRSLDPLLKEIVLGVYSEPIAKFLFSFMGDVSNVFENLGKIDLSKLPSSQLSDLYELITQSITSANRLLEKLADVSKEGLKMNEEDGDGVS